MAEQYLAEIFGVYRGLHRPHPASNVKYVIYLRQTIIAYAAIA